MSHDDLESVAGRIAALMKSLPPKEGRKSRLGHISIEDFAALLETSKQRVIDWRNGKSYPDLRNRERLAAVSRGRYVPDDFKGPTTESKASTLARLEALERKVQALPTAEELRQGFERLRASIDELANPGTSAAAPAKRPRRRGSKA